jgi:hypothetical protein
MTAKGGLLEHVGIPEKQMVEALDGDKVGLELVALTRRVIEAEGVSPLAQSLGCALMVRLMEIEGRKNLLPQILAQVMSRHMYSAAARAIGKGLELKEAGIEIPLTEKEEGKAN